VALGVMAFRSAMFKQVKQSHNIKKYKATFWYKSQWINTVITAPGQSQARIMVNGMYPGLTGLSLTEMN
jgi:hypothetical protein